MKLSDLPLRTRPGLVDDQEAALAEWIVEGRPLADMEAWIRQAAARRIAKREGRKPPYTHRLRDRLIVRLLRDNSTADVAKAAGLTATRVRQIARKIGGNRSFRALPVVSPASTPAHRRH